MASKHFSRILITGTTSGLGRAFHQYYCEQGAEVIEVNRRAILSNPELPVLQSEIIDITSPGEVFTLLTRLQRANVLPELFILNAGINVPDYLESFDYQNFSKVMNINVNGVLTFISAIHRLGLRGVTIATISSTSNIVPNSANIAYHLSKLNLKNMTSLFAERDRHNHYKTAILSPVLTNIQVTSPPSPGLTSFLIKLLAVSPRAAARACAKFFEKPGTVFYFTKPACLFYGFIRLILVFFPFLYRGTQRSEKPPGVFVPQT